MKCNNFLCNEHDKYKLVDTNCGADICLDDYSDNCEARKRYNRIVDTQKRIAGMPCHPCLDAKFHEERNKYHGRM